MADKVADEKTRWLVLVVALMALGFPACRDDEQEPAGHEENGGAGDRVETRTWTNDRSRLSGDRLANFVPFRFEYPADWQVLEDGTGETPNFVKVEAMTADRVTIENFAVGWYSGAGADEIVDMLEPQFSQAFPNYERLFGETHHVDGTLSPGFTFQTRAETNQGPTTFWGRAIAVPVTENRGIVIVMFASEHAPGVISAAEVGEVGNLERILDSFDIQGET